MNISTDSIPKDCLKERYEKATSVTQHGLETSRLQLLRKCLDWKRPIASLRVKGLRGMPEDQAQSLIQEMETKAVLRAIENKQRQIRILSKQIDYLRRVDPESTDLIVDHRLLHIHQKKLDKKITFLARCDDTKFATWQKKKKVRVDTVAQFNQKASEARRKKKARARARKDRRKDRQIRARALDALERNLVVNLSEVEIPLYSVAILSYGPGWIPCPKFDDVQFKLDGYNAANKQAWKAIFKDSTGSNDLPVELLKKPITSLCSKIDDSAIKTVRDNIVTFVETVQPKKCQPNMNRFEKEGYDWLKKAVSEGTIAVTSADKGGAIIIVTPEIIKELTAEKVSDTRRYRPLQRDPTTELRSKLIDL